MPTRLALRGFIHGGTRYKRNDPVTADAQTIEKMAATGLVGKEEVHLSPEAPSGGGNGDFFQEDLKKVIDTSTTSKITKPPKAQRGKKSSASPAVQASTPPTLPPLQPGVPPPLPDAKSSS